MFCQQLSDGQVLFSDEAARTGTATATSRAVMTAMMIFFMMVPPFHMFISIIPKAENLVRISEAFYPLEEHVNNAERETHDDEGAEQGPDHRAQSLLEDDAEVDVEAEGSHGHAEQQIGELDESWDEIVDG